MPEPLVLRDEPVPEVRILVRLGSKTLADEHLRRSCEECHGRWGFWGFSVFEVPGGDYSTLVLPARSSPTGVSSSWPTDPTLSLLASRCSPEEAPHWRVVLSEPTPLQFARVQRHFRGPVENPAWAGHRPPVE